MNLYTAEGWNDFLVAAAGAAGALTGLVFLGITINVQRIIWLVAATGLSLVVGLANGCVLLIEILR